MVGNTLGKIDGENISSKDMPVDLPSKFLRDIGAIEAAFEFSSLHYVGFFDGEFTKIEKARIRLFNVHPIEGRKFAHDTIRARACRLADLGLSVQSAIQQASSGTLALPDEELHLPTNRTDRMRTSYQELHAEGLQNQNRLSVLTLSGAPSRYGSQTEYFDCVLRAAEEPYFSMNELAVSFGCGTIQEATGIEVIADNILSVDGESTITGQCARIWLRMARQLHSTEVRFGYRVLLDGEVVERRSTQGKNFEWQDHEGVKRGYIEIPVEVGSVLQCFATYNGVGMHYYWISDPSVVQNNRRAVYECFDSNLDVLNEFLFRDFAKNKDARDFEAAVAWLLWFLGFNVSHLGHTARMSDGPDLLATTPRGDYLVIECTTGLLKAENKLARLVDRSAKVRKKLDECGSGHLRVLPVIVTAKSRDEVVADLEQARKLGVVVVTRENLVDGHSSSILLPNAELFYEEGIRGLSTEGEAA